MLCGLSFLLGNVLGEFVSFDGTLCRKLRLLMGTKVVVHTMGGGCGFVSMCSFQVVFCGVGVWCRRHGYKILRQLGCLK